MTCNRKPSRSLGSGAKNWPVPKYDSHLLILREKLIHRDQGSTAEGTLIIHIFDNRDVISLRLDRRRYFIIQESLSEFLNLSFFGCWLSGQRGVDVNKGGDA